MTAPPADWPAAPRQGQHPVAAVAILWPGRWLRLRNGPRFRPRQPDEIQTRSRLSDLSRGRL